jgi:hypothetical protein
MSGIRETLRETLVTHLPFLRDWGYDGPEFGLVDILLPTVDARFASATRLLVFTVGAESSPIRQASTRHALTAHVYRNNGDEEDDRLNIEWFAALHRPDLAEQIEQAAHQGTLAQFVRTVVPLYRTLFLESMQAILNGTAWESGTGDPRVARQFAFLERDLGFSLPQGRHSGQDITHTYRRGEVAVNITWDGGPHEVISIQVGERPIQFIWRTPPAEVIAILRKHPEILDGNFRALAGIAVTY